MGKGRLHLRTAFYASDYKGVVTQSVDSRTGRWDLADLGVVLGALCFLGRVDEALVLFELHGARVSEARRVECRFFLGLGLTRRSDYAGARRQFGRNLVALRRGLKSEAQFYVFQGIAFYRYFCGRWGAAGRAAEQAFRAAVSAKFLHGRVLAADLRGHVLVQTGRIGDGLRHLAEAEELSRTLRNAGVAEAIRISIVNYEAEYGLSPRDCVRDLRAMLAALAVQDTYSRAALGLELARQLMLRGRAADASAALDESSRIVYMNQNRRQEVMLNLRYAQLFHLTGDAARGLNHVQSARRALDPAVDHALELSVSGQELALVARLGVPEREAELRKRMRARSLRYGGAVNRQILARDPGFGERPMADHSDRLGRLKDQIVTNPHGTLAPVLTSGLLGLLYGVLGETPERPAIYLDLEPGTLTFFDRGEVGHERGLTAQSRRILLKLAAGPCSKEELIRAIWGYTYHPLRHDPLVYTTLAGLRKLLGSRANWIETTETGYRLLPGVAVKTGPKAAELSLAAPPMLATASANGGYPTPMAPALTSADLNHRQLVFLRETTAADFVGVAAYQERFGISPITALRDLADLHRQGLVVRVGRARATRYAPVPPESARRGDLYR